MALYNANWKVWVLFETELNFELSGSVKPVYRVESLDIELYNMQKPFESTRMALEIVFIIFIFVSVLSELKVLFQAKFNAFRYTRHRGGVFTVIASLSSMIMCLMIISMWVQYINHPVRKNLIEKRKFTQYPELNPLAEWQAEYVRLNALNILVNVFRSIQYFQVTQGGRTLVKAIAKSIPDVLAFLTLYMTVMLGYAFVGNLLFGLRLKNGPHWKLLYIVFMR